jgi:hypothetical protein
MLPINRLALLPHSRGAAAKVHLIGNQVSFSSMWAWPPETWPCGTSDIQSAAQYHSMFFANTAEPSG